MLLDAFSKLMMLPVGIGIIALILFVYKFKRNPIGQGTFKLGGNRIASGLLAVVFTCLVLSYIQTYFIGLEKIEHGDINKEELFLWILKWGTTPFFILVPILMVMFVAVGLPAVSMLFRLRKLSVLICCLAAMLIMMPFCAYFASGDAGCKTDLINCTFNYLIESAPIILLTTLGFGLGAGIPLFKMDQINAT